MPVLYFKVKDFHSTMLNPLIPELVERFASLQAPPFLYGKLFQGSGQFLQRQDAGLSPARSSSGNCLTICRLFITTVTVPRTDTEVCLSRRQQPPAI
jgi:hypothetical protein